MGRVRQIVGLTMTLLLILGPGAAAAPRETAPAGGSAAKQPRQPTDSPHVPGEILVKLSDSASSMERAGLRARLGVQRTRQLYGGCELWTLGSSWSTARALAELTDRAELEFAEPNYLYEAFAIPDDPAFPELYGLLNTGQTCGATDADIDAELAWNITRGDQAVVVAVIDTGVDYNHPDLAANMWINSDEIPDNRIDDDLNGYVDDVRGWNFVHPYFDPMDDNGHGTHVAGTIGALGNNTTGVVGVNWQVQIMPLKWLDALGESGPCCDAIAAIQYAVENGARISNNSWGGPACDCLRDAIAEAYSDEHLFVAASGNDSRDIDDQDQDPVYPAGLDLEGIVAVAATDRSDELASFSNWGATSVDLGAPGARILSTLPGMKYGYKSGTSMATPHVAGVAALILAKEPGLSAEDLRRRILDNVDPIPALQGRTVTGGRLNAFRSLVTPEPDYTPPASIDDLIVTTPTSNSLVLEWTVPGDDGSSSKISTYDIRRALATITDEAAFDAATPVPFFGVPLEMGLTETLEVGGLDPDTTYYFAVRARDEWENVGPLGNSPARRTLPAPAFDTSPAFFDLTLTPNSVTTRTLKLENLISGTSLDWRIHDAYVSGPPGGGPHGQPHAGCGGLECPAGPSAEALDLPKYRFVDSDLLGDASFVWTDITQDPGHEVIEILTGDTKLSGEIDMEMSFPYFGDSYTHAKVSVDGWLVVGSPNFTVSGDVAGRNQPLPSEDVPSNLIAPFWTDLDFGTEHRASYLVSTSCPDIGGTCFIVQYDDVPRVDDCGSYTFQAILQDTGDIRFKYLSMDGPVTIATVGVQDRIGKTGLEMAHFEDYVRDGFEVRLTPSPQWVRAASTSGVLEGGDNIEVTLELDARRLPVGSYTGVLRVSTNDPLNNVVEYPLNLEVVDTYPTLVLSSDDITEDGITEYDTLQLRSCEVFDNSTTTHTFEDLLPPTDGGRLELEGDGNIPYTFQIMTLSAEGFPIGSVMGKSPVGDPEPLLCPWCRHGVLPLSQPFLELLLHDEEFTATVSNNTFVKPSRCDDNRHGVRLVYTPRFSSIDFGATKIGRTVQRSFTIENPGTEDLIITSIQSDSTAFTPSPDSLTIAPDDSAMVLIDFSPTFPPGRVHEGILTIEGNDPFRPETTVALRGFGGGLTGIRGGPSLIEIEMEPGSQAFAPIYLWVGSKPVNCTYTADIQYSGADGYLTVHPEAGNMLASTGVKVGVLADAADLSPGLHKADVVFSFDDSQQTTITIGVEVTVTSD